MLRLVYELLSTYGLVGLQLANMCLVVYLFWKLFTNHLHHITLDIKQVGSQVAKLEVEVKEDRKEAQKINNRLSKIEGRFEDHLKVSVPKKRKRK